MNNGCDVEACALFDQAIDLIDPPRCADDSKRDDGYNNSQHELTTKDENDGIALSTDEVKRVKFEESTCFAPREVTATDAIEAIEAYDLLVHAASLSASSSREDLTQSATWKKMQHIADTYRALLVTSCLLLELLPRDETTTFSPILEKTILSTGRRCILLLKALERICAAKSVSENNNMAGGDDIRDYDRAESDFISNYDWHDDGYLPLPFCYSKVCRSSVLDECCYLPIQQDPPCSKYERNAWTRHWLRSERLVSMNVDDYYHYIHHNPSKDDAEVQNIPAPDSTGSHDDGTESKHTIEGSRKKRRRIATQTAAFVEDRNAVTREGFLLMSVGSCGEARLNDDKTIPIKDKRFIRVYCKLHPSGWLSVEDRSIPLKTHESDPPMQRRRCWKFFVNSKSTCQPCLDGTLSFHFRLEAAEFLGSSMVSNHNHKRDYLLKEEMDACNLLFAVDDGSGGTFVDGCGWVDAFSGAASLATFLRIQIRLEWDEKEK